MAKSNPDGYLAVPSAGPGPGVLVLHAWWGLNETMRGICDRLAGAGFTAFAPDLYHGKVGATIADAEALMKVLDADQATADVAAAARYLLDQSATPAGGLAVIGFSLGAAFALDLAAADPEHISKVVLFYGMGGGDFSAARAAYLGHFAENDPYESAEYIASVEQELRGFGRNVTFHHYPGVGHWFFEPDRADAYNAAAAALAWDRTLQFLREQQAQAGQS